MTESCALPTIWTLVNTRERQRNLRRCYTDCYTTSRRCFVIAVSPRPSANPDCRILEHQPVGPLPRPGSVRPAEHVTADTAAPLCRPVARSLPWTRTHPSQADECVPR